MGYYFKMYKNDLENFYLPSGLIDVAFGPVIKTFSCTIVKEHESNINKNESTVTIEIEQNIDKETNNRTIILVPRNYPFGDKIKVHLVNYMDEAYINSDYDDYKKNKVKYYFTLDKEQQNKFIKWNGYECNTPNIIMMNWNNSDRDFFKIKHIKDDHLKDYNVYSIMINPNHFHVGRDFYNSYQKQVYKSFVDEEFDTIRFFTAIDAVYNYINELKYYNDVKIPWNRSCVNVKQDWKFEFKNYVPADVTNTLKKETEMPKIKDIKLNGPATILFTTDNKKVVVKCRPGDNYDLEKGILMALCKYIVKEIYHCQNWTKVFNIPYSDEIDVEKVIAMSYVKEYFYKTDKDWHYNYVLKYMYNALNYTVEDRVRSLKAIDYSVERIARCLNITKGEVKDILESKKKTLLDKAKESLLSYLDGLKKVVNTTNEVPDNKPCNMEELPKKQKDVVSDQDVIDLFNKGYSISKISKELGLTEYFVKKYLDAYTNPKTEKKAAKILKKATKEKISHKKHVLRTEIDFPDYLEKEECEKILAATKLKYADNPRVNCMSELQKFFIRECKIYKIRQLYGNGYSMYEIAKIIGTTAAGVQKMYNGHKEEIELQIK